MNEKMFCRQCEQTAMGKACTKSGVCGKNPEASALMDSIIYTLQGIGIYSDKLREKNKVYPDIDRFVIEALFTTVTNVNFDSEKLKSTLEMSFQHLGNIKKEFINIYPEYDISQLPEPALLKAEKFSRNDALKRAFSMEQTRT